MAEKIFLPTIVSREIVLSGDAALKTSPLPATLSLQLVDTREPQNMPHKIGFDMAIGGFPGVTVQM